MLFYLKRAESGQTSLFLTVISGSGQSSCFYLGIPSFKDLLVLREREFWIGRSRHEKLESSSSLLLLHYFFSLGFIYAGFGFVFCLIQITLYLLLYMLYFHPYSLV